MIVRKEDFKKFLSECPELYSEKELFKDLDDDQLFNEIKHHVETHKYFLQEKMPIYITFRQAIYSWYQNVYEPLMLAIDKHNIQKYFKTRTRTELYISLSDYCYHKYEQERSNRPQAEAGLLDYYFIPYSSLVYQFIIDNSTSKRVRFIYARKLKKLDKLLKKHYTTSRKGSHGQSN